ncbi:hypothetical protein E2562_004087 [Oryza meyeriana var. granulata]|uniref:Uncharacterized protein n=1 Tax=Oryza meyeriana var. granulata TaxID=110450 RepID=A0A6G1BJG2_9ORYZ|nr:hypothetical protein E2562_004087 [Oryza meyeriana var. granulata]
MAPRHSDAVTADGAPVLRSSAHGLRRRPDRTEARQLLAAPRRRGDRRQHGAAAAAKRQQIDAAGAALRLPAAQRHTGVAATTCNLWRWSNSGDGGCRGGRLGLGLNRPLLACISANRLGRRSNCAPRSHLAGWAGPWPFFPPPHAGA